MNILAIFRHGFKFALRQAGRAREFSMKSRRPGHGSSSSGDGVWLSSSPGDSLSTWSSWSVIALIHKHSALALGLQTRALSEHASPATTLLYANCCCTQGLLLLLPLLYLVFDDGFEISRTRYSIPVYMVQARARPSVRKQQIRRYALTWPRDGCCTASGSIQTGSPEH